ncbi:hypothetical protein BLNAU_21022 [Blattamonas nauphoetae]|uniref:Uncharacterized protein n=1 Tax=Blattamonas nauphoetae TaxID=2049346 RepID=A0ABQ9WXN3_9EUKA|nr:hypothetical protein BLNAU_21022 [Blattamonas nauphoetae]
MLPDFQQNVSKTDDKDEMNDLTIESVLEWLSDSSVHPRNKVHSFQWFHIPTLLTTHIQSQPTTQNNEVLSQLLQRMMTILDECFDCQTPIANKRLLHSSLSQLSQSPSLDPKIKRGIGQCLDSLENVEEGPFVVVSKEDFESMKVAVSSFSNLQQIDQFQTSFGELERKNAQLEKEKADLVEEKKTQHSTIQSLLKEKERIQKVNEQLRTDLAKQTPKLEEQERSLTNAPQAIQSSYRSDLGTNLKLSLKSKLKVKSD